MKIEEIKAAIKTTESEIEIAKAELRKLAKVEEEAQWCVMNSARIVVATEGREDAMDTLRADIEAHDLAKEKRSEAAFAQNRLYLKLIELEKAEAKFMSEAKRLSRKDIDRYIV